MDRPLPNLPGRDGASGLLLLACFVLAGCSSAPRPTLPPQPDSLPAAEEPAATAVAPLPVPAPEPPLPPPEAPENPAFSLLDLPVLPARLPAAWVHRPAVVVVAAEEPMERVFSDLLAEGGREPEDRAALLLQRARVRQNLWQMRAALADLEAAAVLAPRSAIIPLERARLLGTLQRPADAAGPLRTAFRRAPESLETAAVLGVLRFEEGRHREAAEALGFHLEGGAPADSMRWLHATALQRAGRRANFAGWRGPRDPWPGPLEAFLAGRIEREALIAVARATTTAPPEQVACLTWFYLGQRALAEGEREQAVRDLFGVLASGYTPAAEYRLAVAELTRLGALSAE